MTIASHVWLVPLLHITRCGWCSYPPACRAEPISPFASLFHRQGKPSHTSPSSPSSAVLSPPLPPPPPKAPAALVYYPNLRSRPSNRQWLSSALLRPPPGQSCAPRLPVPPREFCPGWLSGTTRMPTPRRLLRNSRLGKPSISILDPPPLECPLDGIVVVAGAMGNSPMRDRVG